MKTIGIYVHIPFCKSKCFYCDFYSKVCDKDVQQNYVLSLIKEIQHYSNSLKDYAIDTIYIGGGTPSILMQGLIPLIVNTIKQNYNVLPDAEISIEANPNTINYNLAFEWKECGINRVSVGLQTASNKLLKVIGRSHTLADYVNAIDCLKKVGFNNINTDIMLGLPKQKGADVKFTIRQAAKHSTHLSCYTLILEPNTKMHQMVDVGELKLPSELRVVNMFNFALRLLSKFGFRRYEVSNFCRKNNECKHNTNLWNMHEYIGFGASAHSFVDNVRYNNIANIDEYIANINNNVMPVEDKHVQTETELFEETLMLGLRLAKGVNLNRIKKNFGIDLLETKKEEINKLINLDLIQIKDNHLSCKNGFNVLNQIILMLI